MGKEIMHLESDSERSDWLLGFHAGALGKSCREGWPSHKVHGFTFGSLALAEAEGFRAAKSRAGHVSADTRRKKTGSAQPNSRRTQPRTESEQCSTHRTDPEQSTEHNPEQSTEQSTEQPPNQPTTYRQQPSNQATEKQQPATPDFPGVTVTPREAAPAWKSKAERVSERRQAWLEAEGACDFTKRPGRLQFASYCRAVHPQWTKGPSVFDDWALHGWNYKGKPIASWFQLLDSFAEAADQSEYGERLPMGEFASRMNLADGMSAKQFAHGEPL